MNNNEQKDKLWGITRFLQPNPANVVPLSIAAVAILLLTMAVFFVKFAVESHFSAIDLLYTPASATVTIDGEIIDSAGQIQVTPGSHEIIVQKYGFETEVLVIETYSGQTTAAYFVLEPNEDFTFNWYANNYNDMLIAQGISSHEFDIQRSKTMEQYPAFAKLPIWSQDFAIFQATCKDSQACVMINASNSNRNDAIKYFREEIDSDLGRYYFSFKNYPNPFAGEG